MIRAGMRITNVETIHLRLPEIELRADGTQDAFIIRIDTDEGVSGYGEADTSPTVAQAFVDMPASHSMLVGMRETLLALRHSEQLLLTLVIPLALLVGLTLLRGLVDLPDPRVNAAPLPVSRRREPVAAALVIVVKRFQHGRALFGAPGRDAIDDQTAEQTGAPPGGRSGR